VRRAEPLVKAVGNGASFEVLSCLVEELGADVNREDDHCWTALAVAAGRGHHDTVRYLVEELGADVNSQDNTGLTPLYVAAGQGHRDVVQVLLNLGADIDRRNNDVFTPLMIASIKKHSEVIKWLVKAGADAQALFNNNTNTTAAALSRHVGASAAQTAYLDAKTHCFNAGCSGAGIVKCTGCKQARSCGEACQLAHWKAHKSDCRRWSAELAAGNGC
jgi:hypothetical protein